MGSSSPALRALFAAGLDGSQQAPDELPSEELLAAAAAAAFCFVLPAGAAGGMTTPCLLPAGPNYPPDRHLTATPPAMIQGGEAGVDTGVGVDPGAGGTAAGGTGPEPNVETRSRPDAPVSPGRE